MIESVQAIKYDSKQRIIVKKTLVFVTVVKAQKLSPVSIWERVAKLGKVIY